VTGKKGKNKQLHSSKVQYTVLLYFCIYVNRVLKKVLMLKGKVSRDLMRIKRPAYGFIGMKNGYNLKGFIFNLNAVFIFIFLNLYAQPASHVGAHASGRRTSR
jgi:hypothetical protein